MTENEILDMYNKLESSRVAQLNQQRNDTLNQLSKQKTEKTNDFYNDRNSVDVANSQNINAIRERMAAAGNLNGGANIQAQLNANSDRMNNLGKINHSQDLYNTDMNDKTNSTNADYNNQINSLQADYDSKKISALDSLRQQQEAQAKAQAKVAASSQTTNPWDYMQSVLQNGGYGAMINWLQDNKDSLTSSVGSGEYQKMRAAATKVQEGVRQNEAYNRNTKSW